MELEERTEPGVLVNEEVVVGALVVVEVKVDVGEGEAEVKEGRDASEVAVEVVEGV